MALAILGRNSLRISPILVISSSVRSSSFRCAIRWARHSSLESLRSSFSFSSFVFCSGGEDRPDLLHLFLDDGGQLLAGLLHLGPVLLADVRDLGLLLVGQVQVLDAARPGPPRVLASWAASLAPIANTAATASTALNILMTRLHH